MAKIFSVDHITIPSRTGRGVLKRVSEVFDCWFESGSMPYAQNHYPFERKKIFEENFPADFIAEGIDQTRGWFYTLLVLSTCLFGKPPFKNLICNGLVLAEDGSKMSKRKKNYPDPMEIVNKYGADALRLYLINSPVVRGENLRFRESGVNELLKDVFLPWFNAYRFLAQNLKTYESESGAPFELVPLAKDGNVMDRWEMNEYRLYAVVAPLTRFFDTLTNCYIRLNRKRIKGESGIEEQAVALSVLCRVLSIICRLMAPFTPFFSEYVWQHLKQVVGATEESVHFCLVPKPNEDAIDEGVERSVQAMRSVMELVRVVRDRKGIAIKYPLKEMIVINRDAQFLDDVDDLSHYILSELNVRKLVVSSDKEKYGVRLKAEPNFRLLGARLKGDQKKVAEYLKKEISQAELAQFLNEGKLVVVGYELTSEEVSVSYSGMGDQAATHHEYHSDVNTIVVVDVSEDDTLLEEGLAREVTNRIQKLRKAAKLVQTDKASVYCTVSPPGCKLSLVLDAHKEKIQQATGTPMFFETPPTGMKVDVELAEAQAKIKDAGGIKIWLVSENGPQSKTSAKQDELLVLYNGKSLSVRLTTKDAKMEKYSDLLYEIRSAFGLWSGSVKLAMEDGKLVHSTSPIGKLMGKTVNVVV
ncbi:unnamed protein product, partial [Mesorhabditis belari]|uniref:Isoleucyl-tRNA synthetase n=1 Tax=Mesorhabditis belari TaxID=2138241 RepID=A0AAF3FMH7_9BILA